MPKYFLFSFLLFFFCCFMLPAQELSEKQRSVADRYGQLEQILLRMSDATASSNPRRAALLKKVLLSGKDKLLTVRLENIAAILERRQLTEAVTNQEEVEKDLLELLQLLESENRNQRRTAEKEKIKEFLRNLEELIHQEKSLKNKTAQKENENLTPLEKEQKDVRLRAQTLRDQISDNENPNAAKKEEQEKNPDASDKPKSDESKDKSKDADDKKESAEKEPSPNNENVTEKKDDVQKTDSDKADVNKADKDKQNQQDKDDKEKQKSEQGSKKETEQKESNEQNEQKSSDEEPPSGSPTRQAMQKALQRMNQAEKKLQKAEKSGAIEDQEEAIAELQRAKAELEKILRQIREEELLQTLEKLEARFKRMLRVEQSVRAQTEKVGDEAKKADETITRQIQIQASRIGADQQSVTEDADAALVLLREDGTAQAMVESLLQARFDMTEVKARLDQAELDSVTLEIEDVIIVSLQEMLDAVQLAIKEAKKREEKQQQTPGGGGDGSETEPLIQLLSELKMIRSMQQRVNERTERYEKEIDKMRTEPDSDYDPLRKKVEELARQQNRISRILHDLKVGKAK